MLKMYRNASEILKNVDTAVKNHNFLSKLSLIRVELRSAKDSFMSYAKLIKCFILKEKCERREVCLGGVRSLEICAVAKAAVPVYEQYFSH